MGDRICGRRRIVIRSPRVGKGAGRRPEALPCSNSGFGFAAALMLLALVGFGHSMDSIASGILALAVVAPLGALAGLIAAVKVATAMRGESTAAGLLAMRSCNAVLQRGLATRLPRSSPSSPRSA